MTAPDCFGWSAVQKRVRCVHRVRTPSPSSFCRVLSRSDALFCAVKVRWKQPKQDFCKQPRVKQERLALERTFQRLHNHFFRSTSEVGIPTMLPGSAYMYIYICINICIGLEDASEIAGQGWARGSQNGGLPGAEVTGLCSKAACPLANSQCPASNGACSDLENFQRLSGD